MEIWLKFVHDEPIAPFAILLAVILLIPPLFERIRLPGLVGLLVAGVVLGQSGLNLLQSDSAVMELLSDIGLVYLMFVAGLEVDVEQFQKTKYRSAGFGFSTFIVPMIAGTTIGRIFGFDWNASILIGSLLASHTLLAYPIVSRLGVVNNEAVIVTIGATIFTDIGALLVLAVCVAIHGGDFSLLRLLGLLASLTIYTALVLLGLDRVGRAFFQRSGDQEGNQFLFILLAVFLAAVGAQLIGVEKIVGAFLAGLAVNGVVGDSPVKEKVVFVGSVLFIPIFFVDMGLLIDVPTFIRSLTQLQGLALTLAIVVGLVGSKFLAALVAQLAFRYSVRELIVMWSLSLPQVAATLAATLVGYRAGLLTENVVNSVIVLMLITATLGPVLTARFAPGLGVSTAEVDLLVDSVPRLNSDMFAVVVPVYNPQTEQFLIELGAMLAHHHRGQIVPLSIAVGHTHMNDPALVTTLHRSELLLSTAVKISQTLDVPAVPLTRIDSSLAQGISRASREQNANLIVMGWGKRQGVRAKLLGTVIDQIMWSAHCPVAMARLLKSPREMQRILVPIEALNAQSVSTTRFALELATSSSAELTLLHIATRRRSIAALDWMSARLKQVAEQASLQMPDMVVPEILVKMDNNIAQAIADTARHYDLVILPAMPRITQAGGLAVSDLTHEIVQKLTCSLILLGEPHRIED